LKSTINYPARKQKVAGGSSYSACHFLKKFMETQAVLLKKKFVGPRKIEAIKISSRKTYLDKPVVDVRFKDGSVDSFPLETLQAIATDKTVDFTTLRDIIAKPVIEKLIVVMLEAEVPIVDIEHILANTSASLNQNLERANVILWQKDLHTRTLADIHQILTAAKKDGQSTNNGSQR
jgi:hypothetical protein